VNSQDAEGRVRQAEETTKEQLIRDDCERRLEDTSPC
jgi:hypothetical protein